MNRHLLKNLPKDSTPIQTPLSKPHSEPPQKKAKKEEKSEKSENQKVDENFIIKDVDDIIKVYDHLMKHEDEKTAKKVVVESFNQLWIPYKNKNFNF
jgi:hypothetical protein